MTQYNKLQLKLTRLSTRNVLKMNTSGFDLCHQFSKRYYLMKGRLLLQMLQVVAAKMSLSYTPAKKKIFKS